jgi:hypothetical protein
MDMNRIRASKYREAEKLLDEIASWSEEELDGLPKLYREKAREFRRLTNSTQE